MIENCHPNGFTVHVHGERWSETTSLANAAAEDTVFALDRTTGTIRFGDGEHGRRPESGSEVTVTHRQGAGEAGNAQVSVTLRWPPPSGRYLISIGNMAVRIFNDNAVEQFSGEQRLRYYSGQLLGVIDLADEQEYHRQRRYLHNRLLHGPGVIAGLELGMGGAIQETAVVVAPGYALDGYGRELFLNSPVEVEIGERPSPQYLTIEYAERETNLVPSLGKVTEASRIEEGVLLRLADQEESEAIAIGRIVLGPSGWEVDASFRPPKPR